jgi:hypothetical protein
MEINNELHIAIVLQQQDNLNLTRKIYEEILKINSNLVEIY